MVPQKRIGTDTKPSPLGPKMEKLMILLILTVSGCFNTMSDQAPRVKSIKMGKAASLWEW